MRDILHSTDIDTYGSPHAPLEMGTDTPSLRMGQLAFISLFSTSVTSEDET